MARRRKLPEIAQEPGVSLLPGEWAQAYWVRFQDGSEVGVDQDRNPNPAIWTRIAGPGQNKHPFHSLIVSASTLRCFILKSREFYDIPRPAYQPWSPPAKKTEMPAKPAPPSLGPIEWGSSETVDLENQFSR